MSVSLNRSTGRTPQGLIDGASMPLESCLKVRMMPHSEVACSTVVGGNAEVRWTVRIGVLAICVIPEVVRDVDVHSPTSIV